MEKRQTSFENIRNMHNVFEILSERYQVILFGTDDTEFSAHMVQAFEMEKGSKLLSLNGIVDQPSQIGENENLSRSEKDFVEKLENITTSVKEILHSDTVIHIPSNDEIIILDHLGRPVINVALGQS